MVRPFLGKETATDANGRFHGEFQLPRAMSSAVAVGSRVGC